MRDRQVLEDAFWAHVPECIEGYCGRIDILMSLLDDEQLQEACGICGIEEDEYDRIALDYQEGDEDENE